MFHQQNTRANNGNNVDQQKRNTDIFDVKHNLDSKYNNQNNRTEDKEKMKLKVENVIRDTSEPVMIIYKVKKHISHRV